MCVEPENFDPMDDFGREPDEFERELREAMQRRPAPFALKRKILERREFRRERRLPGAWIFQWEPATAVLAAMILVVVAAAAGFGEIFMMRQAQDHRRGEEAKQQVFTALRITSHALDQMNAQLEEQNSNSQ
jgi:hypothetical protein